MRASAIPLWDIFILLDATDGVLGNKKAETVPNHNVPKNIRKFYDEILSKGSCSKRLATGFWATDPGNNTFSYCGDHLDEYGVIYIQGRKGRLADMDIDCDGAQGGPMDDGRCSYGQSPDLQNTTAFQDTIAGYKAGITDLNTYVHPYVVFGNDAPRTEKRLWTGKKVWRTEKKGWKTFDPTKYGVRPLSVMAVVCGDKLVYGIWGDTNGDDGNHPMVGETSLSLATACEGVSMTGDNGHSGLDVLYLAFRGEEAVPGADGADWGAKDFEGFEKSIKPLGEKLLERVGSGCERLLEVDRGTVAGAALFGVLLGLVL